MEAQLSLTRVAVLGLLATLTLQLSAFAQGTAFTYQGQLQDNGNPASGTYDLRFGLFTVESGGSVAYGYLTNSSTAVSNGLFTVTLDFGSGVFNGTTYWLQIGVRTNGAANFKGLTPRQQLTPAPYAIFAEAANAAGLTGTVPPGSVPDSSLSPDVALLDVTQTFTGANSFNNNISLLDPTKTIIFPATSGANSPMMAMFSSGTANADRMVIAHSLIYPNWGLQYQDSSDKFNFLSGGTPVLTVNLGSLSVYAIGSVGIGTANPAQQYLSVHGGVNIDQANDNGGFINNGSTNGYGLTFGSGSGEGIASQRQAGANQYGLDFYTDFNQRMSLNNSGNLMLDGNDLYLLEGNTWNGMGYRSSVAGVSPSGGEGIFVYGLDAGYLGTRNPDAVALTWDWHNNVTAYGEYLVVNGATPVYAYIGDDGAGNDVQIGSQKSGITAVSAYNTADNAYMHFYCSSITIKGGADLAEPFKISAAPAAIPPGAVLVIDEQNPGHLKMSDREYDTRVAGVISGANGVNPGIQMQQQALMEDGRNVALTGRVYVQAEASNGAIMPGDLLTTSSTPGHAMRVTDHARAQGAVLGKAMTPLTGGKGMVLVLVTLQ
ncbi:MAG TPA: hypothetical protein VMU04_01260 [Candidatus Acidoferrum sp.]|nr:hypothetical protein [Candidatus Acidoferrum sp.]